MRKRPNCDPEDVSDACTLIAASPFLAATAVLLAFVLAG